MPTKEQGRTKVEELVQHFRANLNTLRRSDVSELTIRQRYLNPFWEALGWNVTGVTPEGEEEEVIVEEKVRTVETTGIHSRRCDYTFRIYNLPRFTLEAKKPSVSVEDRDAIYQAKTYGWHKAQFAVLSNFEGFRLYDASIEPEYDNPHKGLITDFKLGFEDYITHWNALWDTFSRDAVSSGSLDRLFQHIKRIREGRRIRTPDRMLIEQRGSEPVDRKFLEHLEDWRKRFAAALFSDNRATFRDANTLEGSARLTSAVQRLIDRLVFIRVGEDRDIFKYGGLQTLLRNCRANELFPRLQAEFRRLNVQYNGYLFLHHDPLDTLTVDGTALAAFITSLYQPARSWMFDEIGDDILGIVYERFLGSVISARGNRVIIEPKPEVRHAEGVYYTPRFVVDSIVRRVLGPRIKGKSPRALLKFKVLDPACGSGSFLIAAYQFLMDHCLRQVRADPTRAGRGRNSIAFRDQQDVWHLTPQFRAELLTSCIYGVDIDQQAVEVTVMSLYIKMLEAEFPLGWQQDFLNQQLLPKMVQNVRCGNSLIQQAELDDYLSEQNGALFGELDTDSRFRINPFDWNSATHGFGHAFVDSKGFDCIIGNPPYIRVQELKQWAPTECAFYKDRFKSCARGNFDIYVAFLERGLELLAPKGLLGFICPHKFWQATYGKGIREIIASGNHLVGVVDFGHQQVFEGATTYTAIHVLAKNANRGKVDYSRVDELTDGPALLTAIDKGQRPNGVSRWQAAHPRPSDPSFAFVPANTHLFDPDPAECRMALGELCTLAQGLKTGADKVFVVTLVGQRGNLATIRSDETQSEHVIESALLRPLVKNTHMRNFEVAPSDLRLLFPYDIRDNEWSLITPESIARRFPRAWTDYLLPAKPALERREDGRYRGDRFYQYSRPQNFVVLSKPKLLTPDMADQMRVGFDETGEHIFSGGAAGGVAIVPPANVDPWFIMGLLNSKLIESHVRLRGTTFAGGWLNCEIRFIRNLPIQLPRNAAERHIADRIGATAQAIATAKQRLRTENLGDNERERLEREVEAAEAQINRLVNQLYGVETPA